MTIIEKINYFFKKNFQTFTLINAGKLKVLNKVHFLLIASIIIIIVIVFSLTNFVKNKNAENQNNLKTITTSREFSNLTNFFFSKISSPYKEVSYTIKNNDTIEKILKNFDINNVFLFLDFEESKKKARPSLLPFCGCILTTKVDFFASRRPHNAID